MLSEPWPWSWLLELHNKSNDNRTTGKHLVDSSILHLVSESFVTTLHCAKIWFIPIMVSFDMNSEIKCLKKKQCVMPSVHQSA